MNAKKQKKMEKTPHISGGYDDVFPFVSISVIIYKSFV